MTSMTVTRGEMNPWTWFQRVWPPHSPPLIIQYKPYGPLSEADLIRALLTSPYQPLSSRQDWDPWAVPPSGSQPWITLPDLRVNLMIGFSSWLLALLQSQQPSCRYNFNNNNYSTPCIKIGGSRLSFWLFNAQARARFLFAKLIFGALLFQIRKKDRNYNDFRERWDFFLPVPM